MDAKRDFQLIIDLMPIPVAVMSPDHEVEGLNRNALDYFGKTLEELEGCKVSDVVHPDDLDRLIAAQRAALAADAKADEGRNLRLDGADPFEVEIRARRFDGVYRWFQSRGHPLRDASGRIVRWYNLLTDIDERKRAESELRRAHDSFADAQRLSRTGSFIADPLADDHIWSDEAYRIFEFEPGTKITRQRVREAVHPDDLHTLESVYARHSEGEDVTFEYRIVTASGAVKHLRGLEHLIEKVAGRPLFIGALQDVTETRVAEQALDKARSELNHASRAMSLGVLTASIAHEVNQPLSGIITNAGTCLRMLGADPPNLEGAIETTRRTLRDGKRAAAIITRLRTLFGKKEFAAEPVDLNAAAREVMALTRHELQRHRIAVQAQLDQELPKVIGDHVQLQQVILNLLLNAADATKVVDDRPRRIVIETARDGGSACVSVRDTGVGIQPEALSKLFDAFFTTKADGMGIGLSVSHSIVEHHGGHLWATPNDGPGATFAFSVPCASLVPPI
jgi:PAS domain S-box-containing protein